MNRQQHATQPLMSVGEEKPPRAERDGASRMIVQRYKVAWSWGPKERPMSSIGVSKGGYMGKLQLFAYFYDFTL
jgi:hypothetical protein